MVTNSLDSTDIALEISHATMKRPQKIQSQKNQPLNFSKNKKLLESVHGARRKVLPKSIDLVGGGSPQIGAIKWLPTSAGGSHVLYDIISSGIEKGNIERCDTKSYQS